VTRLLVALAILFALGGVASAQAPDKATKTKAAAHFKQGKAYFDAKQWDRAITEYEAAWALIPQPLLQFNIALALEQKGDLEAALTHFQTYLALEPNGAVSDEAREDVARLSPKVEKLLADRELARLAEEERVRLEAEEAERVKREADRLAAEERDRKEAERLRQEAEARRLQEEADAAARAAARARAAPLRKRARILRWSSYGAFAIVGIGGAAAALAGMNASDSADAIEGHTEGPWTDELLAEQARGRAQERRMYLASGIAGGALVGAGVLLLLARSADHRADALEHVSITAEGHGGVGVALGGRW
jgi:tetratricopeptide (TPR) repeat protein